MFAFAADEAKWNVIGFDKEPKQGESVIAVVEAQILSGWHLYSVIDQKGPFPTTFSGEGIEVGSPIKEGPLVNELDKGFSKNINFFKERALFEVPLKFTGDPKTAKLKVRFQLCNNGTCLPPKNVALDIQSVQVGKLPEIPGANSKPATETKSSTSSSSAPTSEAEQIAKAKAGGLLTYILAAFSAGLLALLTPCVFPMIPITVSFFSKRKESGSSLSQAIWYCGGIIGTFTILGIAVSLLAGASGLQNLANNAWLNLALATIFIVLALSLFGVFEIGIPTKFVNKFDASGKSGFIAPVLMGLTFSLTSFTCTLPFVGAVLVSAASGDYFYPTVGMLAFSTAFSIPFFLLALFPQLMSKLPRSGAWMVVVKAYMGFIELIAAVKFLGSFDLTFQLGILTKEVTLAIWFTLLVLAAIYLLGWIKLPKVDDGKIGWLRRAIGIATLVSAMWIANALNGGSIGKLVGFLPPSPYPYKNGAKGAVSHEWERKFLKNYDQAVAEAQKTGKRIFIDFTGQFCTNCRVMENNVFPDEKVTNSFDKFVCVTLYTDRNTPEDNKNQKFQESLNKSVSLPTYSIVESDGKTLVSSVPFTEDPQKFNEWLTANGK
jgi:thiol:disulfide interchange protein